MGSGRTVQTEERLIQGETRWVAIRARGAEWSWLTPEEAAEIGREWIEKYGDRKNNADVRQR